MFKNSKQANKFLLTGKLIITLLYIHTENYCTAVDMEKLWVHASTWMNLSSLILSEISNSEKYMQWGTPRKQNLFVKNCLFLHV